MAAGELALADDFEGRFASFAWHALLDRPIPANLKISIQLSGTERQLYVNQSVTRNVNQTMTYRRTLAGAFPKTPESTGRSTERNSSALPHLVRSRKKV